MKNIETIKYIVGLVSIILASIIFGTFLDGYQNFTIILILIIVGLFLINISSIFFYKTLKTDNELFKYLFSGIHTTFFLIIILFKL